MEVLVLLFWMLLLLLPSMTAHAETLTGDVRIVDGDTLGFEGLGVTVRLDGIDTPERLHGCQKLQVIQEGDSRLAFGQEN